MPNRVAAEVLAIIEAMVVNGSGSSKNRCTGEVVRGGVCEVASQLFFEEPLQAWDPGCHTVTRLIIHLSPLKVHPITGSYIWPNVQFRTEKAGYKLITTRSVYYIHLVQSFANMSSSRRLLPIVRFPVGQSALVHR